VAEPAADEAALVERAQRGDPEAFDVLVTRHQELAFRVAYLVTRDADDAADAAQNGFIKAHRALRGFHAGAPFRPWLVRIVGNEARNIRRSAARRALLPLRLRRDDVTEPSPEATVVADERRRELLAALDRAPEPDRLVVAYRFFLDLGEAEMAVALDCPPGTVKSRLSRALGRLREDLREHDPEARPGDTDAERPPEVTT
jgi:RNA polymerase sigma factor (sigma-70 family)